MLTVITPADNTRLTTIDAVRTRIGISETVDDEVIEALIDEASAAAVSSCRRVFAQETVRQLVFPCRAPQILIERTPATDLTVTEDGSVLVAGTDYHHDTDKAALIRLFDGRPTCWTAATVQLDYKGGYVLPGEDNRTLPAEIEGAVLLMIGACYSSQSRVVEAVKAEEVTGVGRTEFFSAAGSSSAAPGRAEEILDRYRRIII